jgi:hypothetical protein
MTDPQMECLTGLLEDFLIQLKAINASLATMAKCCSEKITGIVVHPGPVTTKGETMAKKPTVTMVKKSTLKGAALPKKAATPPVDFQLVDNGDSTCTVYGVDASGAQVDISSVATITASSSDTTKVTVAPPVGMTFVMSAVGPLTTPGSPVTITVVATWTAGGVGPFTFTLEVDVIAGGPTGIIVVPGPVTVH